MRVRSGVFAARLGIRHRQVARLVEYGGGHAEAVAHRSRDDPTMERGRVGARAPGLAVSHEHARDAHATRTADEPMARHARAAVDEFRPTESTSGVVHAR